MQRMISVAVAACLLLALSANVAAQSEATGLSKRTTLAVRYPENKKTVVNLTGTPLAPRVTGRAEVEMKRKDARIRLKVENLDHPQNYGPFYTTYIVWAVTPEGQADNLSELPPGYMAELQAQSTAQTFGLLLTAEPHGSVKFPSPRVIAETTLPKNAAAGTQTAPAEYRGDKGVLYEAAGDPSLKADYTTPRLVLGARRAAEIARKAQAKEFAAGEWQQVQDKLASLEQLWPRNLKDETKFSGLARDVMRVAQVAREQAAVGAEQARQENERQDRLRRLAEAKAEAERAQAEAERSRREAERVKVEAEQAKAAAEAARLEAEKSERTAAEERTRREQAAREAEAAARTAAEERARREQAAREAEEAKAKAEVARAGAEAERRAAEEAARRAEAERAAARAETEKAKQQVEEVKRERDAALQKLYVSLAEILDTKRETRGFIVNLGDVLFDTGKATLKPAAREKLSKLAGILLGYPGALLLEVEGHTDAIGSEELNQKLSLNRAASVRDYLTQAGVKGEKIKSVQGFGKTKPIAPNETAAGRQMNRRVEVVIQDAGQPAKTGNQ